MMYTTYNSYLVIKERLDEIFAEDLYLKEGIYYEYKIVEQYMISNSSHQILKVYRHSTKENTHSWFFYEFVQNDEVFSKYEDIVSNLKRDADNLRSMIREDKYTIL